MITGTSGIAETQEIVKLPKEYLFEVPTEPAIRRPLTVKHAQSPFVVALIPAYNEERYIGSVVLKTLDFADAVIVVDDGSLDRTSEIAERAGAFVVRHQTNKGKGEALNTGFTKACELFLPTVIVTLDGDWQHNPEELPQVIAPVTNGNADIVIGSRYIENKSDVPIQRVIGHMGFNTLINTLSGTVITDSQSGFRAFSLRAVEQLKFSSSGFSVESEMQFLASKHGLMVEEVPITIRYIDKPKRSLFSHGLKVLNGIMQLVGQHRPLLYFGLPGFIVTLMGIGISFLAIEAYNSGQHLPFWEIALGVFLWVNGTVMLFVGIVLHSLRGLVLEVLRSRTRNS